MQNDANVFVYNGGDDHHPNRYRVTRKKLTHVHVNEGVTSIPKDAFSGWDSLKSAFIAEGVTTICARAFYYSTNLVSIWLPDSLETIGEEAFFTCEKLVKVRLPPTSVSTIGLDSFRCCHSIISIKLHSAIQHIDHSAFGLCISLLSIQVPPSTTKIGNEAFASCTSLMIAYFPSTTIQDSDGVFGKDILSSRLCNPNLILLTDRDDFVYHDNCRGHYRGDIPTLTLRAIQQCIHNLPNNNNTHAAGATTDNDDNYTNGDSQSTTRTTPQQQQLQALHQVLHNQCPNIAQRAQQSGLNLLHLLVYFPGDILRPLTMLLGKCPLVTTAVDNTGRTPFHHTITSTQQNMDSACYDLLASRTPDKVVHLAIRSGAPWHEVYDIVEAKVNGLSIVDEESGLMPFMMVAVENEDEDEDEGSDLCLRLNAVYELLCMKPDVIKEYVDVVSAGSTGNAETCVGDDGTEIVIKRRRLE